MAAHPSPREAAERRGLRGLVEHGQVHLGDAIRARRTTRHRDLVDPHRGVLLQPIVDGVLKAVLALVVAAPEEDIDLYHRLLLHAMGSLR